MSTAAGPALTQAATGVHLVAASAGTISFLLIWLTTVSGIALRNGWLGATIRHSSLHGLHMIGASTGLVLGLLHGVAQLAAPIAKVRPVDLVVPFGNRFDPVGIGIGVLGLEIMLAAAISVPLQRRLGFTRWRLLHNLNHVAFMLLVAHVLISGSDVGRSPVWLTVLGLWLVAVLAWAAGATGGRLTGGWTGGGSPAGDARPAVRIDVDAATCRRFGFCEHEAPEVFRLRDDGRLAYRTHVPQSGSDAVLRAATACPVRAVLVRPVQGERLTGPATDTSGPTGRLSVTTDPRDLTEIDTDHDTDGRGRVVPLAHRGAADRRRSR